MDIAVVLYLGYNSHMIDWPVWLLALVLGVILRIFLNEPFQYIMARVFGGIVPRRPRGVKGIWLSTYKFPTKGRVKEGVQIMELRQIFNYVTGKSHGGNYHRHRLRGRIRGEMYLTGVWVNVQKRMLYHGAFQLYIHHTGGEMIGKWVGFEHKNQIAHNVWSWKLLSESVKKKDRLRILREYEQQLNERG